MHARFWLCPEWIFAMKRLPPLGALEAFVVVAQHESLTLASRQLNLTVSALSRRIQTLEQDLGTDLFERQKRKFALLPVGHRLLDEIAPTLEFLAQTTDHFRRAGAQSCLRLGVPHGFATTWLMPRQKEFNTLHPTISIEFDTQPLALHRLGTELDAAIILSDRPVENIFCEKVVQNYIVPVCAASLLDGALKLRVADPAWLRSQTALVHRDMTQILPVWLAHMGFADLKPNRIDVYDSGALLLEAAVAGLGIAFMLDMTVETALQDGRLIEPFQARAKSPLSFCFVAKPSTMQDRALARFHDWLMRESLAKPA
jgi:LysR family transcriptional regulator, glycine cleavage system transcriptional activator